ncbi:aminopeptidase [Draconibacterium sp.]|nr:aminopeptidase [Draconibacterium sp.]
MFDEETIELAATNIIKEISNNELRKIVIINSYKKKAFVNYIIQELENSKFEYYQVTLGNTLKDSVLIKNTITNNGFETKYIFMITPEHAGLLFDAIGRPDTGLKLPENIFYCDWLANIETTIRTYGIDYNENLAFQETLRKTLDNSKKIQIIAEAGTNITIHPRYWKTIHGEIYTAPIEKKSNGKIIIDACAYWGPPTTPIELVIKNGRVINLDEMDADDKHQKFIVKDLNKDINSNILAELGIGTNLGAKWNMDLMESEQARGTCHFGFGLNTDFGGQNSSVIHVDYVIKNPTIIVDDNIICDKGVFLIDK